MKKVRLKPKSADNLARKKKRKERYSCVKLARTCARTCQGGMDGTSLLNHYSRLFERPSYIPEREGQRKLAGRIVCKSTPKDVPEQGCSSPERCGAAEAWQAIGCHIAGLAPVGPFLAPSLVPSAWLRGAKMVPK